MTVWPGLSSPDCSAASITPRVKGFYFYEQVYALRRQTIYSHYRRIPDCVEDTLVFPPHIALRHCVVCDEEHCARGFQARIVQKPVGFSHSGNRCCQVDLPRAVCFYPVSAAGSTGRH
jgi:hypothetical protein